MWEGIAKMEDEETREKGTKETHAMEARATTI